MQINLGDNDAAAAFKKAVQYLSGKDKPRLLLAVSGGPDSLAMLILAYACMPNRIVAATVDHQLRPESAKEADYVAELCAGKNIPHHILTPGHQITGNIQSAARNVRYALLETMADEMQCDLIATAHHSDDQLETLLMRLARGSGIDGLAGIRARNGRVIRPLLGFTKADLEQICTDVGVVPIRDPSNDNTDFDRVAMRQFLEARQHPFDTIRAARTASAMGDAAAALDWMTADLAAERISQQDNDVSVNGTGLPRELQRRLVLIALRKLAPEINPRGEAIERLLDDLYSGRTTTIGDILCKGGSIWHFSIAPPRQTGLERR